jgi:hypothetical protein
MVEGVKPQTGPGSGLADARRTAAAEIYALNSQGRPQPDEVASTQNIAFCWATSTTVNESLADRGERARRKRYASFLTDGSSPHDMEKLPT